MDKENLYYYINKVYILFMHCLFRSILYKKKDVKLKHNNRKCK